MRVNDLFEEEDEIGIKDPKAQQALKAARVKYGWATNDLEAFVAMMQDEQETQDDQIDAEYAVNTTQEKEINNNDHEIARLDARIDDLENNTSESLEEEDIEWEPQPDFKGRTGVSTSYGDSAKRQRKMTSMPTSNRRYDSSIDSKEQKIQSSWKKVVGSLQQSTPEMKQRIKSTLIKIIKIAKREGIMLNPSPATVGKMLK